MFTHLRMFQDKAESGVRPDLPAAGRPSDDLLAAPRHSLLGITCQGAAEGRNVSRFRLPDSASRCGADDSPSGAGPRPVSWIVRFQIRGVPSCL
jgi:hypothetical protein